MAGLAGYVRPARRGGDSPVPGSLRRRRMLAAGLASFSLISLTASVVTGTAASAASGPAAAAPAPAVPASDSFVAQPQVSRGVPDVRQACSTPTTPGQMACMALVSTLAH